MPQLIAFRAVQGLGGGGLMVISMAVVGDLVAPRERGRYQGLFGGVFGVATVAGPLLGGFFVDNLSWRWIFYINIPLGALALIVISAAFRYHQTTERHAIDWLGALVLTGGVSGVILYTSLGGTSYSWTAPGMIASLVGGLALLAAFPFVGTALSTVALYLLSRLGVTTSTETAAGYMLLLGFGLGLTMQVLVLAAQNAVPHRLLGVTTSGASLARQLGGSIGVSVFGA